MKTKTHFMLDIETTGIDPKKEEILQIALVRMDYVKGYWQPGAHLNIFQHTDKYPISEFAKKHQVGLYNKCRAIPKKSISKIRQLILSFVASQGIKPDAENLFFCGWNASNFDIPFLVHKKVLIPATYDEKGELVGDFHYRIYEITGVRNFVMDLKNWDNGKLEKNTKKIKEEDLPPVVVTEYMKEHDALFDCYDQIAELNCMLWLMKEGTRLP